ncbi:uncharacterized protein LOC142163113 [Nicotiana tabacum]|uniref:Uncharacterized protein LOC142163113 n=1 Tax=Nicotiana tabacum TaxID=4097 RepID=A0AC58RUQ1_TOBAC
MGVLVYMETKKENMSLGTHPLCITVRDFDLECSMSISNEIAGSSETLKLIDMSTSPKIVEYESIIITENTPTVIEVGQVYKDKKIIASAMKHYSVMNKFQFRVKRPSARSYCLVCVGEDCTWHFKSTSINDSAMFKVRKFNSLHTCSLMNNTSIQHKPTSMIVGSMVIPKYADPKTVYTPKDIQTDMLSVHGVNLTYMQAWRAKKKALEFLRGHPTDFYSRLPSYLYIMEKTYLGSVVKLKKTDDNCFLYTFVAMSTSINGWKYYSPVVVVDGTFLKSAYRGIMLTASTMDATGSILTLAYAVVDSENEASWKWFLSNSNMHMVKDQIYYIHTVPDGVSRYIVCLENKRCSCGQFQLDELPCPHVLAALRHRDESYEQYCSPYYTRESLLHTYKILVDPLPDESK